MNYNSISSQETAQIIYTILLMILLIVGFFNKNISFKKITQYAGMWILIGLVAIILYSFRYNFSDVKNQVATSIFPAKAINKNNKELTISASQDGHFYILIKVNNKDVKFMIDTGASEIIIDKNLAQILAPLNKNLSFNKIFQTANGQVRGANILLDEIDISGIKFQNIYASVTDSELPIPLLGMSFLKRFEKYEFYRDKLVLTL